MASKQLPRTGEKNCAIREHTADGVSVGRCWHFVGDTGQCPRHGDVRAVQDNYIMTGKLTDDEAGLRALARNFK
jgi:hypothetical protein